MSEMSDLFKLSWGAETLLAKGWAKITDQEKQSIKKRMDDLFKNDITAPLYQNREVYVHIISLLAQLELLALQVPLRFESKLTDLKFKAMMRQQLLDEIFHGLVFTRIAYELSVPNAQPPAFNKKVDVLCDFLFNEEDPKVAVVLLNLVCEGWTEEIFKFIRMQNIIPEVMDVILADEHRHVCEADLYRELGLPDVNEVKDELNFIEEHLINDVIFQPNIFFSMKDIWGTKGNTQLMKMVDAKHRKQLAKINLLPGEKWKFFMWFILDWFQKYDGSGYNKVTMNPTRRVLMTEWDAPKDPTINSMYEIDVTPFGYFDNKYNKGFMTLITAQALSQMFDENPSYRRVERLKEIFEYDNPRIGIVAKLSGQEGQLCNIIFENCHDMNYATMAKSLRRNISLVNYCNKKCNELAAQYPHLTEFLDDIYYQTLNSNFGLTQLDYKVISLSDVTRWNWSMVQSPLRPGEAVKLTSCNIQKKQVWNQQSKQFVTKDILALAASIDHRIFDGDMGPPAILQRCFDDNFAKFEKEQLAPDNNQKEMIEVSQFAKLIDQILCHDLELGFKLLVQLRNSWPDYLDMPKLLKNKIHEIMIKRVEMA